MLSRNTLLSPHLRLKEGEIVASVNVPRDVKPYLAPIFVAAPPNDRDPQKGRKLTNAELVVETGKRVARAWGHLPCMLDIRFLTKRLGLENAVDWVPKVYHTAVLHGANVGAVINLADAHGVMLQGYVRAMKLSGLFPAIRLSLGDMQMSELEVQLSAVLGALATSPIGAVVILDFGGSDLSVVSIAADVFAAAYERLAAYGTWHKIIISSTSYPEKNPAPEDGLVLLPRNELAVWEAMVDSGAIDPDVAVFGDYGPDSSKFEFKGGGSAPIPHYRYSTSSQWLVVRGNKRTTQRDNVLAIAEKLTQHTLFMGSDFSYGDRYYFDSAAGDVTGGATEWRAANVNHHLQLLAHDVGALRGLAFSSLPPRPVQTSMFDSVL